MDNKENTVVDIKEANQANIAQKEKEQFEDVCYQEREKNCEGLEKGNELEATDVEALPLQFVRQLEKELQATDLNAVSSQLGRPLENRRPDTDSDALSSKLEEQLAISEHYKRRSEMVTKHNISLQIDNNNLQQENKVLRTKGEKVAKHNINLQIENNELKEEIKELKQMIKCPEGNENMLEMDREDGRRQETAAVNVPEGPPSVSKKARNIHQRYRNPFHCPASCVLSAAFFILTITAKKKLCSIKFVREIEERLSILFHELYNVVRPGDKGKTNNQDDDHHEDVKPELKKCSSSLQTLEHLGLIGKAFFHSGSINGAGELDKALQEAVKVMYKQEVFIALIVVVYKEESGAGNHCMTIRRYNDQSDPLVCTEVYDPQSDCLWPNRDKYFESVSEFFIYKIEKEVAKEFTAKCEFDLCREEHQAATRSFLVTGVVDGFFDECEFWDDFYIRQQLEETEEETEI